MMRRAQASARLLAFGILMLGGAGCVRFIMLEDTVRRADGWTIVLTALKDGPNSIQTAGDTYVVAPRGSHFLWAWFDIRNDLGTRRVFGYDTCDMDLGDTVVLPVVIAGTFWASTDHRSDEYGPGETSSRHLLFAYPARMLPARIRCGNMIFALPSPGRAGAP